MQSKNIFTDKQICIVGTGGFAKEVYYCLADIFAANNIPMQDKVVFSDRDDCCLDSYISMGGGISIPLIKESELDFDKFVFFIAIGEPSLREKIVKKYPSNTQYATIIHPSAIISDWVTIGEGSIVCAGSVLTCNIQIGKQAHINLNTTIGHDCIIDDYFTTAPSANISGNCHFGNRVYFGTNSCVRQGVNICDDVTVGMGGVVVKDIHTSGVYIGNPLKQLQK